MSYVFRYDRTIRLKKMVFRRLLVLFLLVAAHWIVQLFKKNTMGWEWVAIAALLEFIGDCFNTFRVSAVAIDPETGTIKIQRNTAFKEQIVEKFEAFEFNKKKTPSILFKSKEQEVSLTEADGFDPEIIVEMQVVLVKIKLN